MFLYIYRFSFPQTFLKGLQNYARNYHYEIDLLTFEFKILDNITQIKLKIARS